MNIEKLLNFIEDKEIEINNDWYFHATGDDIEVIKKILDEGIKSAYLRGGKGNHFNGKYYISLYKNNTLDRGLNLWLDKRPKLVINNISPLYADSKKYNVRRIFINSKIPLRTSEWVGEYQQYMMIEPSKFVAIGYDLLYILNDIYCQNKNTYEKLSKDKLELLKNIILYLSKTNNPLPIYDFSTKREINKEKVLSLYI